MTPEQITEGLYTWLLRASRVEALPMGSRPCTWAELSAQDPDLAAKYRRGVALFLDAIDATADSSDEHLNFIGKVLDPPPLATDDDGGAEPPPIRPDD